MQNGASRKLYQPRIWTKEEQSILDEIKKEKGYTFNWRNPSGLTKHFICGPGDHADNSKFDFEYYINTEEKKLKGLVHFGTHVQGPKGMVHGGAIAAILDNAMGSVTWKSGLKAVTLNLSVNYRKFIPLDTTMRVECEIEKIDRRKLYLKAVLKNLKGDVVHNDATGLFLVMNEQYKDQDDI